jgi:phage baseplate assembly protein W
MPITSRENTDHFAYDISSKIISKGECYDTDVINQEISNILGTNFGSRVFNLGFGSSLGFKLFEIFDTRSGEELLNLIVEQLYVYLSNQITIDEANIKMDLDKNNNSMALSIPYSVKNTAKKSYYKKKFIL